MYTLLDSGLRPAPTSLQPRFRFIWSPPGPPYIPNFRRPFDVLLALYSQWLSSNMEIYFPGGTYYQTRLLLIRECIDRFCVRPDPEAAIIYSG